MSYSFPVSPFGAIKKPEGASENLVATQNDEDQNAQRRALFIKIGAAVGGVVVLILIIVFALFQAGVFEKTTITPGPSEPTIETVGMLTKVVKEPLLRVRNWTESIVHSRPLAYTLMAGVALLILCAITAAIVVPLLMSARSSVPVLPIDTIITVEEPPIGFMELVFRLPLMHKISLIVGIICCAGVLAFAIWNAILKSEELKKVILNPLDELRPHGVVKLLWSWPGLGFIVCLVGAAASLVFGFWPLGAIDSLLLTQIVRFTPAYWFAAGFLAWLVLGLVLYFITPKDVVLVEPEESIKVKIVKFLFIILSFSLYMGAMGAMGGYFGLGFSSIFLAAYMVSLVFFIKSLKGPGGDQDLDTAAIVGIVLSVVLAIGSISSVYFAVGFGFLSWGLALASGFSLTIPLWWDEAGDKIGEIRTFFSEKFSGNGEE